MDVDRIPERTTGPHTLPSSGHPLILDVCAPLASAEVSPMIRRIVSVRFQQSFRDETILADIAWFTRQSLCSIPFVLAASVGLAGTQDPSHPWDMVLLIDLPGRAEAEALRAHPEYRAFLLGYLRPKIDLLEEHDFTFVEEYSPLQDR